MSDVGGKSTWRRWLAATLSAVVLVAFLVLLMMWLAGWFTAKVPPGPAAPAAAGAAATTQPVVRQTFPLLITQVGTLQTETEAHVSSRILAQVLEVTGREGQTVQGANPQGAGATVLARLDDRDIQARLRQARSQVVAADAAIEAGKAAFEAARANLEAATAQRDAAAKDFGRYDKLAKQQAATEQQLDEARARRDVTEAQVRAVRQQVQAAEKDIARLQAQKDLAEGGVSEAQVMLTHTVILAPITGRIIKKQVDVGDMVGPGHVLFHLETPAHPELHAVVSESLMPQLATGQELAVEIDALKLKLAGKLREIVPKADPATRTVLVKVSLPPRPELVSGLFGRLVLPLGHYDALVVPQAAVRTIGQLALVDVAAPGGQRQRRFVTLGETHGDHVEVLSGLNVGEQVVTP